MAAVSAAGGGSGGSGVRMDADTAVYVRKLLPRKMAKYWLQRYSLFSKFDLGAQMDVQVSVWVCGCAKCEAMYDAQFVCGLLL